MSRLLAPSQSWLFGQGVDLAVFVGSVLAAVGLVLAAPALGVAGDTPPWAWVLLVVCVDVAHVWSTLFRTYLDGDELRRRPGLYVAAPLVAYLLGVLAYLVSPGTFWRLFAYTALLHFIRQQYGWVALYGRKARASETERFLDAAAVYAATLGPVVWWHAHLPRAFWWFVEHDFVSGLPEWVASVALGVHGAVLAAWAGFQVLRVARGEGLQVGKVLLVLATWGAWFGGIVLARDDFAFTAMNVLPHGVPYFVLLFRYARGRLAEGGPGWLGASLVRAGPPGFLLVLLALAFGEELLWDWFVWHEHGALFGESGLVLPADVLALVVPLLALPQATHYLLDAFIWKPSRDSALLSRLGWARGAGEGPPGGTVRDSGVVMPDASG
jgi:hypothetical protein